MSVYRPPFQPQLNPADPYGNVNCTAYAAATCIAFDTQGRLMPTGKQIRHETNEPIPDAKDPGLTLAQVASASKNWNVSFDVELGMDWAALADALKAGHGVILQISYAPILGTPFAGSTTFAGGHSIAILPGWYVYDPLADGRRTGIYHGPGIYPEELLRKAAAELVIRHDAAGHPVKRVGDGHAYAALTPHAFPLPVVAPVHYAYGGEPKLRGKKIVKVHGARVRTMPRIPAGKILAIYRNGASFICAQTTNSGTRVGGSRRWFGDRTGKRWIHSSLVRAA